MAVLLPRVFKVLAIVIEAEMVAVLLLKDAVLNFKGIAGEKVFQKLEDFALLGVGLV